MNKYHAFSDAISTLSKAIMFIACLSLLSNTAVAVNIGQAAPDFELVDVDGKSIKLSDYLGKTVVLEWTNHLCPFVQKHYASGNMQNTQKHAQSQDIIWLSIISSAPGKQGHVSAEEAKQINRNNKGLATTILFDGSGTVGKRYGAKTTPHMYIIDPKGKLRYKGAIDSIASAKQKDIAKATNYVRKALNELASAKTITHSSTKPYGCSVKYQ